MTNTTDWKAETYKKWLETDLAKDCKPWEGAVHQYFANEIIEPLLTTTIENARAEEREKVKTMVQEINGQMYFDHEGLRKYITQHHD